MNAPSAEPGITGCPLAVISPHLDDAVFSCADAIAAHPGCVVLTVFAGAPVDGQRSTDWDRRCGFANAAEAIAARRDEDRVALEGLGARPWWLDFCDSQYDATPTQGHVAAALVDALRECRPARVFYPLGLFHSDHRLVHEASASALAEVGLPSLAYEDALYRALPGLLQKRLVALAVAGLQATPMPAFASFHAEGEPLARPRGRKGEAVLAYASQLRAFGPGGYADVDQPERFWLLEATAASGLGANDPEQAHGR